MTYPNAYEGVKKLVAAEAIQIITAGLAIIIAILSMFTAISALAGSDAAVAGAVASGIGVLVCAVAMLVLLVVGVIFMLIGLKKASIDEPTYFKSAFLCAIGVLVASVLSGVFSGIPLIANILKIFANVFNIIVFLNTIKGIGALADKLNRPDISGLGRTILIIEVIGLVLNSIANFVGGVFSVIASVVLFICYIVYLVYLTKGKKMLEN